MSTLVQEKLSDSRDGELNIVMHSSVIPLLPRGEFRVMFIPSDTRGVVTTGGRYCSNLDELKAFLGQLGLITDAITEIVDDLKRRGRSRVSLPLTQDKIALIQ